LVLKNGAVVDLSSRFSRHLLFQDFAFSPAESHSTNFSLQLRNLQIRSLDPSRLSGAFQHLAAPF